MQLGLVKFFIGKEEEKEGHVVEHMHPAVAGFGEEEGSPSLISCIYTPLKREGVFGC